MANSGTKTNQKKPYNVPTKLTHLLINYKLLSIYARTLHSTEIEKTDRTLGDCGGDFRSTSLP